MRRTIFLSYTKEMKVLAKERVAKKKKKDELTIYLW